MESRLSRRQAFWALNGLPAIGPISLNRLLRRFEGDPRRVLEASRVELSGVNTLGIAGAIIVTVVDDRRLHAELAILTEVEFRGKLRNQARGVGASAGGLVGGLIAGPLAPVS